MDEKQCEIYRKHLEEKIQVHDVRLNDHRKRLDQLEQYKSSTEEQIKHLIERINSLVTTMRWFIGLLVGSFVAFFFYSVQNGVFR